MKNTNENDYSTPQSILKNQLISKGVADESLCDRELTTAELNSMSSEHYSYFELYYKSQVDAAFANSAEQKAKNRRDNASHLAKLLWSGKLKPEAVDEYKVSQDEWLAQHPQLPQSPENQAAIATYLGTRNLLPTAANIDIAFRELCAMGRLVLVPENIGLPEAEITGYKLIHHKNLDRLSQPYIKPIEAELEKERIRKLSGDDFKAEFLPNTEIPQRAVGRIERAVNTFKQTMQPGYVASDENRAAMLEWLKSNGNLSITAMSLNEAYLNLFSKGELPDVGDGVVTSGISKLIDHRKPAKAAPVDRAVTLEPIATSKRISMQDVLKMSSAEMQKTLNDYPLLKSELDSM